MADKYAVRNLRLCTKDCLCLYVCPTGAADTEDSIIEISVSAAAYVPGHVLQALFQ